MKSNIGCPVILSRINVFALFVGVTTTSIENSEQEIQSEESSNPSFEELEISIEQTNEITKNFNVFTASEEEESIPNVSDPDSFEKSTLPKSEEEFKITWIWIEFS